MINNVDDVTNGFKVVNVVSDITVIVVEIVVVIVVVCNKVVEEALDSSLDMQIHPANRISVVKTIITFKSKVINPELYPRTM